MRRARPNAPNNSAAGVLARARAPVPASKVASEVSEIGLRSCPVGTSMCLSRAYFLLVRLLRLRARLDHGRGGGAVVVGGRRGRRRLPGLLRGRLGGGRWRRCSRLRRLLGGGGLEDGEFLLAQVLGLALVRAIVERREQTLQLEPRHAIANPGAHERGELLVEDDDLALVLVLQARVLDVVRDEAGHGGARHALAEAQLAIAEFAANIV
mmetsp:Transcript_29527/g.74200  ORF Transcript_29527/g.74200 Transcript_29527/m.74200 type:complete len:210 (+) Transcript_29527:115-744(+)